MTAPWWMCNGWWSPWCLLDVLTAHRWPWVCDKHDRHITGEHE